MSHDADGALSRPLVCLSVITRDRLLHFYSAVGCICRRWARVAGVGLLGVFGPLGPPKSQQVALSAVSGREEEEEEEVRVCVCDAV